MRFGGLNVIRNLEYQDVFTIVSDEIQTVSLDDAKNELTNIIPSKTGHLRDTILNSLLVSFTPAGQKIGVNIDYTYPPNYPLIINGINIKQSVNEIVLRNVTARLKDIVENIKIQAKMGKWI